MALSNIPDRNPFFTGREQVLAQLQDALPRQRRAALSGLGGIGKTQTAVEYAHRHSDEYLYTFFATAHSREALVSGYTTIARVLKLPESTAQDQTLAVDAVKRWLSSNTGWLLVLDNADDLAMTREFIPPGNNGHVILTTPTRATGTIARRLDIEEMGTDEGALFLLRRAKYIVENAPLDAADEADQARGKDIAAQLDGLPLALDQAGAYIEETGCGLSGYLDLYRKHAPELLGHRGALAPDHPDPVASTWVLSFENIEKANRAAAELLKFCAFLHPDGIPEELFSEGATELGPELETLGSDALALNGAISDILKYSLLRRDPNARTLEIHRLVQAVLKRGMDEATQRSWTERAVRAVNRVFPKVEFSSWPACKRLLPQAQACAELINQWDFKFPEVVRLLHQVGYYFYERGSYSEAEFFYKRVLAIREERPGPAKLAASLSNLARVYRAQGQYGKAEPLFERALSIREKAYGPKHPEVAFSLNNLGVLYYAERQYEKAKSFHERALAIWTAQGDDDPNVATSLSNQARVHQDQGEYGKAEPLFERALAIREKALGPEHPEVAFSLNNLGMLYYDERQYEKAESFLERGLAVQEKALGPDHPDVATSLDDLALLYRAQGQDAKAKRACQRSMRIQVNAYGPPHDVAKILSDLEKLLGPNHPDVAAYLEIYANLLRTMNHPEAAAPMEALAMTIRAKHA